MKRHSKCTVFTHNAPEWEGAEIHGHTGVIRRNTVIEVLLITPNGVGYVIPKSWWTTPDGLKMLFEPAGGWFGLVQRIRDHA